MERASAGHKPHRIGFSTPGVLDPKFGTMKNCNTVAMNGRRMKDDLESMLGVAGGNCERRRLFCFG